MTAKDLRLIDDASKIRLSYPAIGEMIKEAESEEAKAILEEMENRAFIRAEQAYGDTL